ncbi:unnamed protein product [Euphydryas editha]|uniref:Uncharacterized protein n=1 Tax=Euphydryas editha TaxID=104508 RepID=A0AAU9TT09_EUPED|nr:unnamed protein product [Euphydryas editha]
MVAVVAFTIALQVKSEPQGFIASSSSKSNNKRYATQEFTLFLTPSEIKSLSKASYSANKEAEAQSPKENSQYILQSYSQPELNEGQNFFKQSSLKQSNDENLDWLSAKPFLQEPSPVYENQEERFDPFNSYQEQKSTEQEEQSSQKGNDKKDVIWIQYNPFSKSQEESLLHEDLQQQWNRLLEHNRGQLRALSSAENEKQNSEDSNAKKESNLQRQFSQNEQNNSEIKKGIQFASKNQAVEFGPDNSRTEEQAYVLRSPFLIHKEVKVTKHLPVPVIKKVQVKVPTPVLVPVPEPYEVKVPHPYPVPYEIIKHIPVPIIRKY